MVTIRSHRELRVYQAAFEAAKMVLRLSRGFPSDEKYELTKQIRAAARSVCANLAEAWRKRRYAPAFLAKLTDAEAEAAETQVWLDFALEEGYITPQEHAEAFDAYEKVIAQIVLMGRDRKKWAIN